MTSNPATSPRLGVLHSMPVWLPQTETWLYDQILALPGWIESRIVCDRLANCDQFPVARLDSLDHAGRLRRVWDRSLRKLGLRRHLGYLLDRSRGKGIDLVHSHFGNFAWADRRLACALGARHVATFYGFDVNRLPTIQPIWRRRYQDLFRDVDLVLCEGPHMAECIAALGCPRPKLRVQHLGVRVDSIPFEPRCWQPGEPLRLLVASSFREKKGIPYAVEAIGQLTRDLPVELTMVGGALSDPAGQAEKASILAALDRHHLRAAMPGFLPYERLMQVAGEHHIFLSPSVTAADGDTEGGAPIGILHMAASGMPVVATRHCDIPNLLPFATDLAEERDVDGLLSQLRTLVASAGQWEPRLAQTRRHIEQNFNAAIQGQRLAQLYASLFEWQ